MLRWWGGSPQKNRKHARHCSRADTDRPRAWETAYPPVPGMKAANSRLRVKGGGIHPPVAGHAPDIYIMPRLQTTLRPRLATTASIRLRRRERSLTPPVRESKIA